MPPPYRVTDPRVRRGQRFRYGQVRPKQAYVDWANSIEDDRPRVDVAFQRKQPHVYLVEAIELLCEFAQLIDDYWEPIFYEQLDGWMRDPECWRTR